MKIIQLRKGGHVIVDDNGKPLGKDELDLMRDKDIKKYIKRKFEKGEFK